MSQLATLVTALRASADVVPTALISTAVTGRNLVFVGSGDSLSSGLLATAYGHRAHSSGDITWTGRVPAGADTVVGISHSGTSAATVRALRIAREAGLQAVAVTSNPASPLAAEADVLQLVPSLDVVEEVPCAGHLMLGLGVAAACGMPMAGATDALADALLAQAATVDQAIAELPTDVPSGISVLSLPDLRGAGDFWSLKLIEATGLTVRTVPLEESGHVDYFIGAQPHLTLDLVGVDGPARHARLAEALTSTGQWVQPVVVTVPGADATRGPVLVELAGAVVGTLVAAAAATRWGRPPFRGGAVNMDASHIKLDGMAVVS